MRDIILLYNGTQHAACHETCFSVLSGEPTSSRYFYAPYFSFLSTVGPGKGFEGTPSFYWDPFYTETSVPP